MATCVGRNIGIGIDGAMLIAVQQIFIWLYGYSNITRKRTLCGETFAFRRLEMRKSRQKRCRTVPVKAPESLFTYLTYNSSEITKQIEPYVVSLSVY